MAPQNSTLIHENADMLATEIIRYSPILTQPNERDCDSANSADDDDYNGGGIRRKKSIHNFSAVDTQVKAYYTDDDVVDGIKKNPIKKYI